jgi:hypothetical protein
MDHASASFIQHTILALYSNLDISLKSVKENSIRPRHRQLEICVIVSGKLRVTGKPAEWDV